MALDHVQFAYVSSPTGATGCPHMSEDSRISTLLQILKNSDSQKGFIVNDFECCRWVSMHREYSGEILKHFGENKIKKPETVVWGWYWLQVWWDPVVYFSEIFLLVFTVFWLIRNTCGRLIFWQWELGNFRIQLIYFLLNIRQIE